MERKINYLHLRKQPYGIFERTPEIDYDSGAEILYVSSHELPPDEIWGSYNPITHTIKINRDLSEDKKRATLAHESGHALGINDEHQTDLYAAYKIGSFDFVRQFSRKPG